MKQDSEQKTIDKISECVDFTGKEVLEIGCGDGRLTSRLVGKPKKLTAIEPDVDRVETARMTVQGADFFVGTGESLDFPDACFDIVLFSLSLHHHQNARVALREAARVVKGDGAVLVLEPTDDGGLEQVCVVVHDESKEKMAVQRAITECELILERSETFYATWLFDDKEDLYQWVFETYDHPFDAELAREMGEHPGVNLETSPIVLQDTMVLHLLKKRK